MRVIRVAMIVAIACGGSGAPTTIASSPVAATPRLVVLIVIDQLPQWSFDVKAPHLRGGIARLVRDGRWTVGRYASAATVTASGHAVLGTGADPRTSGILGNDWFRRDVAQELAVVDDGAGGVTTAMLRVPGVADAMHAANGGRAVAVSLKARASLLPLGQKAGRAVWYDAARTGWATVGDRPAWLDRLERDHPISPRLAYTWQPDPSLARLTGIADDAGGELGTYGFDGTFPHELARADVPAKAIVATPLGATIVVEAAIAAIAGEALGADDVADYLVVSLSSHDYIGHAWGQESWESWDALLAIDRDLERLVGVLDRDVGRGRWAAILTGDHGAAPTPERAGGGGRHSYAEIEAHAEAAAARVLGAGDWIAAVRYPSIYLSSAVVAADRGRVASAITAGLKLLPIHAVERAAVAAADCASLVDDLHRRLCLAIDPVDSGEVLFAPARGVVLHEADEATTTHHGSFHPYDFEVPVILVGPGIAPGRDTDHPVSMRQIAPTIASWLGVPPPRAATEAAIR